MRWCDNRKEWCSEVAEGQALGAIQLPKIYNKRKLKRTVKGG